MFREKVLIATDLSPASLPAIDKGAVLARQFGLAVHLIYVYDPTLLSPLYLLPGGPLSMPSSDKVTAFEEGIRQRMRQLQSERLTGVKSVDLHIRQDPSSDQGICAAARELGAELLIIGTHGRTGLNRVLIGSVAERVVRHAPCPVLTVRSEED